MRKSLYLQSLALIVHDHSNALPFLFILLLLLLSRFSNLSPTLCDPIDGSPPGFSVPGILQARVLEWVAIAFSDATGEGWKVITNNSRQ